ncbi:MAG: galactose-1-phosphate uridylyltransferase [Bacillota bacterium]|nr:galactose-1-phosphate uridylyltransferase [Bacillota bacterium]
MIGKSVEELIAYAKLHLQLDEEDATYKRNLLLKYFELDEPYYGEVDTEKLQGMRVPDELIAPVREYLEKEKGLDPITAELEIGWIMGLLTPLPSQVNQCFDSLYEVSPKTATDYLYDLSIKNNYVAKTQIEKNMLWTAEYDDGPELEISINLSKPEKSNKDIAKLLSVKSTSYPKCMLCHENLGFAGNAKKPARENIRFIPLNLNGEKWFMQYSPYGYYPEHMILFYEKHEKMEINRRIIGKLFDFVDLFPHYFIGSNADLPIVGGSILDHEHFQGGGHEMPLMKAPIREKIYEKEGCTLSILDFYNTVVRIDGKDRGSVLDLADKILTKWRSHDDPKHMIIAKDEAGEHNTITPILQKKEGAYRLFLILRNNRVNEQYPDGIFHAHKEYHPIKSEGIGLIEAAGLFILPARLKRQGALVDEVVDGKKEFEDVLKEYPDMEIFRPIIAELKEKGGHIKGYINEVCRGILGNVAVYKNDKEGQDGLRAFLNGVINE